MDVAAYLQCFEKSLSSYSGPDPLEPWDKFVAYLEQSLPAGGAGGMSLVFDSLVQRFLDVERYADDVRYVNYCIRCASYYSDPVVLYSHVFSKGVGTRTAALYVAWAKQFEQRDMREQADAVYQKALENRAQPAETVLHEYRQFQSRTRSQTQPSAGGQVTHLVSQTSAPQTSQDKASEDPSSKPAANKMTIIVSRSETSGKIQSSGVQTVSAYMKEELVCEGSELCFEEVRAEKYFRKLREKREKEQREITEKTLREQEEGILNIKSLLDKINQELEICGEFAGQASSQKPPVAEAANALNPPPLSFGCPRPSDRLSSRRSLGLRLHTEPTFMQQQQQQGHSSATQRSDPSHHATVLAERSLHLLQYAEPTEQEPTVQASVLQRPVVSPGDGLNNTQHDVQQTAEPEEKLDVSQGHTSNLSHVTPNTSLGFAQATPSRVLPSPTVNTREALGVIMDMFQAPTFLEEPFSNASMLHHAAENEFDARCSRNAGGVPSLAKPPTTTTPFTVFQDDNDKENGSAAPPPVVEKLKPSRALAEIPVVKADKPNETPPGDLMPDESTTWGARYNSLNSLAACPNSTTDFAMLAQFVSTPFTHKTPLGFFQDQENDCDGGGADDDDFIRRQSKKLSPIIEQSPCDESAVSKLAAPSSARQGTIMGEGLATTQHCLTTSSITMVQPPPPTVLSFRDHTLGHADSGPGWEVYKSPEQPPKRGLSLVSSRPRGEPFKIREDVEEAAGSEPAQNRPNDVPMSPECALKPDWLVVRSPEAAVETDLDAFLSPRRLKIRDVPMTPEQPPLCADVPMSPVQMSCVDEPMMSPDRGLRPSADVSMKTPRTPRTSSTAPLQLVSDPWDSNLISHLLSTLTPPLTSHPRCITWQCNMPSISPKMTISMGKASLRVDCVLGEGAFATVYQATDPTTSEKMVLKVQKPANPWEFYINTQLDARLQPDVRHLYSSLRSAHLFNNGSVLLGELHNYGTLLNAVNIYKNLSDKVMPQPLVMYFTVCILHMVEQLHAVHVIHADIKPDNFLLGERFLENRCFDEDSVDHGLVLIDLGQSIDMELFPEGTAFTAKCLTSGFQCTEMLSGKPWSYQTDYFGIAGTVYCLLFGTYMQVTNDDGVWRTNGVFRRNPHSDLWLDFFHSLLNVSDCRSSSGLLRLLRLRLSAVLQQNYAGKLASLKSRLVVLLLERQRAARR